MKEVLLLSEQELEIISQIVCDIESGNHLLCERSKEYILYTTTWKNAMNTPLKKRTPKQKQIVEYTDACKNPDDMKNFKKQYN